MLVIIMQSCWKKKLFKAWKRNINQRNRHLAYYIFFRKLCLNRLERYGENMYLILIKLNIENIKHIKYTQTHIQPTSSQRNTVIYTLQLLMIRGQIQEAHGLAVLLSPLPHRKKGVSLIWAVLTSTHCSLWAGVLRFTNICKLIRAHSFRLFFNHLMSAVHLY